MTDQSRTSIMRQGLTAVNRCLSALNSLEEIGVAVNNVRFTLSALADELELAAQDEVQYD
jgi:hypothetical protein